MTSAPSRERIDLTRVARTADLVEVLTRHLGHPEGRAGQLRWRCPFHADDSPSLYVWTSGGARRWRCWPCNLSGDALDFVARFESVDVVEAARRLDPSAGRFELREPTPRPEPRPEKPAEPAPTWHDPGWQDAVGAIIADAEARLWSADGREALGWLRARGLADAAIRRFRLGFSPDWQASGPLAALADADGPRPIKVARGVVIPWPAPGSGYGPDDQAEGPRWCGANLRRLAEDVAAPLPPKAAKCLALAGSARGHAYPWPDLLPTQGAAPALLVEGEFDALLAHQEAGHLAHALTVGGASQRPDPSALAFLARCPWVLVATDHDGPGALAARAWLERFPHKARRVMLPSGKDLSEFVLSGGDARAWLASELGRLGAPSGPHPHPTDRR